MEFDRYYLQVLQFFSQEHGRFPSLAFSYYSESGIDCKAILLQSLERLQNERLAVGVNLTTLGRAIASANLGISEGLNVYENLKKISQNCCLSDELNLMYVCIPTEIGFATPPYHDEVWTKIFSAHEHVMKLLLDIGKDEFNRLVALSYQRGGKVGTKGDEQMSRIYAAAILQQVIDETPFGDIERQFGIDRGSIQSLHTNTATFAGQIAKFCELCGFGILGAALHKFRQRLNYAAKDDLLELMAMPSCTRSIARLLMNQGIEESDDLLTCSTGEISKLLRNCGHDELELALKLKEEARMISDFKNKNEDFREELKFAKHSMRNI
jgi:hypothetical protein